MSIDYSVTKPIDLDRCLISLAPCYTLDMLTAGLSNSRPSAPPTGPPPIPSVDTELGGGLVFSTHPKWGNSIDDRAADSSLVLDDSQARALHAALGAYLNQVPSVNDEAR